jgi:uncharacterized OsmC-like protein
MKIRPKSYGPLNLISEQAGALTFCTEGGYTGIGSRTPGPEGVAPSDLLLASLGSCILISARMAAEAMGLNLGDVNASVRADKALDLPHRFSRMTVEVSGAAVANWSIDQLEEWKRRTKSLCTVSNTLSAEVCLMVTGD